MRPLPASGLAEALSRSGLDVTTLKLLHQSSDGNVYRMVVRGSHAIATWRRLRGLVGRTGYWPLVLGDEESAFRIRGDMERNEDQRVTDIIQASYQFDASAWFQGELDDRARHYVVEMGEWPADPDFSRKERHKDNLFLKAPPDNQFAFSYNRAGHGQLSLVNIALLPTRTSWHAPAILKFGNWNWSPDSVEHTRVLRYWHERYRTEVVAMSFDTIEALVPQPPSDRASALVLAREYSAYAPDILPTDARTLKGLAAYLLNKRSWFFWWD